MLQLFYIEKKWVARTNLFVRVQKGITNIIQRFNLLQESTLN